MAPDDLIEALMDEKPDATELLRLFLDALKDDPEAQEVVAKEVFGDLWKQLRFLLVPAMMASHVVPTDYAVVGAPAEDTRNAARTSTRRPQPARN
jgi:hypothetical protein